MKHDLATQLLKKSKGRHAELVQAVESNNLNQAGLMQAVVASISDGDHAFADYVTHTVLPFYGRAAIPLLEKAFNPHGNMADFRRLVAIRRLDLPRARKLARLAITGTHADLVSESVRILQGSKKDVPLLLQRTRKGGEEIRGAAYTALQGVMDAPVVEVVSADLKKGVTAAAKALQHTPHPAYTALCVSGLKALGAKASMGRPLSDKDSWMLQAYFGGCFGHGGVELDEQLVFWTKLAADGYFSQSPGAQGDYANKRKVVEAVAMSAVPQAQRLLVAKRESFEVVRMPVIMGAASWHPDLDLVELFAPYVPRYRSRCEGWFCACGGDWPCAVLSAVEFALDVDCDAPGYQGRRPHPLQRRLIERIKGDPRWKIARRT